MTPDKLADLLESPGEWALFDVREAGEAEAGHILGATFLPRRMIEFRIAELVADRSTPIVVYDEGGGRAPRAAHTLGELGYGNVQVLEGGTVAWSKSGRAVTEGANVRSKLFGEHIFHACAVPQITADGLADLIARDEVVVCDIRLLSEHETARIPGAYYAANFDISLLAHDLAKTGKTVVCHCAGRTRSIVGTQNLREFGVEKARALKDGTMGWVLSGRELEKGPVRRRLKPSAESVTAATEVAERRAAAAGVSFCSAATVSAYLAGRVQGENNAYVFDARQVEDFTRGHIPGSLALPGGQAVLRADDFMAVRNAPVVFVDEGFVRAAVTAQWFRRLGYPHVAVCRGGIEDWNGCGRKLEKGRGRVEPLGLDRAVARTRALDPAAADALLRRGGDVTVIDVDNSRSFAAGHLPGAVWVQRGWLEDRIAGIAPDPAAPVLVTCGRGPQAAFAAAALRDMGYAEVCFLDGGIAAWRAAGFPVDEGLPKDREGDIPDRVLPPYARGKAGMVRYLDWEKELTSGDGPPNLFTPDRESSTNEGG